MSEIKPLKAEAVDIKIGKYQCSCCQIRFGTRGEQSAMVWVVTSDGQDTWCEKCYRDGLRKGTCKKLIKLTKSEKKRLKKQRRTHEK